MDLSTLWDIEEIATEPLDVKVLRERSVGWGRNRIHTRDLRYTSHTWRGGDVTIAAHVALPVAEGAVPAMVMGTGDADSADEFCRRYRLVAVAIDRPGTGESTGPEDLYANWVQFEDPRESWMWHYVTAALRAVTLCTTMPEVDAGRIGITGYSRGGTMAWIANGVDPRLKLTIPVATGGDIVRALDHGGWANYIHRDESGQPYIPPEFHEFARYYDPVLYCGSQRGAVVLVVGAQDEYFPLPCTATTAQAATSDVFRMLILANWDHGYFAGDNPHVDAFDNRPEASIKQERTTAAAIRAWLHGDGAVPALPELEVEWSGDTLRFEVTPDGDMPIEAVALQVSLDGAYTLSALPVRQSGGRYGAKLTDADSAALSGCCAYAEVAYVDGPVLTSIPWFGDTFRQRMRPFPEPDE